MTADTHPVFFSESGTRWRAFLGAARVFGVIALLAAIVVGIALVRSSDTSLPHLRHAGESYKRVLNPAHLVTVRTGPNAAFARLRSRVGSRAEFNYARLFPSHPRKSAVNTERIRAGFYVNWDAQSYQSLRRHISELTMVMPEWLFVPDGADTVAVDIDQRALALMQSASVSIVPMLSNYFNEKWNAANVQRIVSSPVRRTAFISSLVQTLERWGFSGVNIDFEDLSMRSDEQLVEFQREVYEALHARGLVVTQDVIPNNTDYDLAALGAWNDYLVLMAYDLHYTGSAPGAITDPVWTARGVAAAMRALPASKLILGIPAYGYDWPRGAEGADVTYEEAVIAARESEGTIRFDRASSCLSYAYADDDDTPHEVWFADAATAFTMMRVAADAGIAGVALWRLGSEDERVWSFYAQDLSATALAAHPFDPARLRPAPPSTSVDFIGEGEILDLEAHPQAGSIRVSYDALTRSITDESYDVLPSSWVIRKLGQTKGRQVAITFDDGPDPRWTPAIMEILAREHVPATFFLVGVNAENNLPIVRSLYADGFELGNHSFTHPNLAEISPERAAIELNTTRRLIESVTGHSTVLFRPPYNADAEPERAEEILPIALAREHNYLTVGESIDPEDWQEGVNADTILARIRAQEDLGSIILLHDAGGDRSQTVAALPRIIAYFRGRGYTFTNVSGLLGVPRDTLMPPLHDRTDIAFSHFNWAVAEVFAWAGRLLGAVFLLGIALSILRTLAIGLLAWRRARLERMQADLRDARAPVQEHPPLVSIIVPAYNEEVTAVDTVRTLLMTRYPNFEIVFVDDGSKDTTYPRVRNAFLTDSRVMVCTKENGGKSSALTFGVNRARGAFVVCIDADTRLDPDAVALLMDHFTDERVAAVAGNVKVGNERTLLARWQAIEYIASQNFDRRAFDMLNAITVVPGAIGAFRTEALNAVGGFTSDTLAEDCDLTIRLLRAGFVVHSETRALAFTEAPETLRMFLRQRFRWSFGIMQTAWKHRDLFLSSARPNLGFIALPNILVFQYLLPLFSPVVDLVMLFSLLGGYWEQTLAYYAVFLAVDVAVSAFAFRLEGERLARLWLLVPQRLLYRQLMYWVLLRSVLAAIKGRLVGWGVLKRTGGVAGMPA